MTSSRFRLATTLALLACWTVAVPAQKQDDDGDAARLAEVLELGEGSTVADIGAGSGPLTVRMATRVGARGRVFATDVNADRLKEIRDAVQMGGHANVTVLEGGSARTNLPDQCCDAVFMRLVYHHFGDVAAMNASLRQSLKPGGWVAVVDFRPDSGVSAPPGQRGRDKSHGVMPETVIEELKASGFEEVKQVPWPSAPGFLVVGQRPK